MKTSKYICTLALGLAFASAHASLLKFDYQARVVFGESLFATNLSVGDYFNGTFSYNSSTPIIDNFSFIWSATYGANGLGNEITATLPNTIFKVKDLTITVNIGPVFPVTTSDSIDLSGYSDTYTGYGEFIDVSLGTLLPNNILTSTALPNENQLPNFEYAGGSLRLLYGKALDPQNFYVKTYYDNDLTAYRISSVGNGCDRCEFTQRDLENGEHSEYIRWLDAGNSPLVSARLGFQITNINYSPAVPNPPTIWLMLAGIGAIGAAVQSRKAS